MFKWSKQNSNTVLIVMVIVAVAALTLGVLVIRRAIQNPPPTTPQDTLTNPAPAPAPAPTPAAGPSVDVSAWQTYLNTKYNYSVMYPKNLKVGSISGNSVLGDYSNPVKGYHVGPLVFVSLNSTTLRKAGADYFNGFYNAAKDPVPQSAEGTMGTSCSVDKINNPNVTVQSVSCVGEGGNARYALIIGSTFDIFVDGYSKGFDNQDNGSFASDTDYVAILSTFTFTPTTTTAPTTVSLSPSPTPSPSPADAPTPTPAGLQTFSIVADDSGANPSQITVAPGTIVEISFNVSSTNVNNGGLDFRSSLVNTGTIFSGQSKTISFTANSSFVFTPYGTTTNTARPYSIQVTVK